MKRVVGTFLFFLVLVNSVHAQAPGSPPPDRTPILLAPAEGTTITHPDSLRFRWRVDGEPSADETTDYHRFYQRLLVTPTSGGQASAATQRTRSRVVRTYPELISDDPSEAEPLKSGPYPVVGDWFPEGEAPSPRPGNEGVWETRLFHPTVGDWYPGNPEGAPLPNGTYRWEIRVVAETATGEEQVLASSPSSTFTVSLAENGPGDGSPSERRTVQLDLFDLRLTGRGAEAILVRGGHSDEDRVPWRIEIQRSNYPVTLRWRRAAVTDSLPDRPVRLVDGETGGNAVDVDMKANGSTEITDSDVKTLEVQLGQVASAQTADNVALTLMPRLGAFLSGVGSVGDISGEVGAALGRAQSVLSWGGSVAFGSRNGTVNVRLTGLRTTGSLVSTTEGVESAAGTTPNKLLFLTGDLVLRPIPRVLVQPYALGGVGARRLSVEAFGGTAGEVNVDPRWDPSVQVGIGADVRVGNVTLGLEVVDYLSGFDSDGGLQHDAFVFAAVGIPVF